MSDPVMPARVGLILIDGLLVLGIVVVVLTHRASRESVTSMRALSLALLSIPAATALPALGLLIALRVREEAGVMGAGSLLLALSATRDLAIFGYLIGTTLLLATVAGAYCQPARTRRERAVRFVSLRAPLVLVLALVAFAAAGESLVRGRLLAGDPQQVANGASSVVTTLSSVVIVFSVLVSCVTIWRLGKAKRQATE